MTSVSVKGIDVRFNNFKVLECLDLEIASGEFVVLLGPSGCGKSTLLNVIAGLVEETSGEIWIGGRNVTFAEPNDRNIGMVFQSYALYPRMTVEGNLSFGLRMAGAPRQDIEKRVSNAARVLQIEPLLKRRPSDLSGGQRQRVAIGRALVRDVGVFLFDEPLSNLDAKLRTELRVEIKRLHRELGATMIFVTHDQIEALTLADRIAVMHRGVIQQFDTPREVYARPKNRFVAEFVGSPAMNFLSGNLDIAGENATFSIEGGPAIDLRGTLFASKPQGRMPASLGIRPEQLSLQGGDGYARLPLVPTLVEPMGSENLVWGKLAGATLSMRTGPDVTVPLGKPVDLFLQPAQAVLFGADGIRL